MPDIESSACLADPAIAVAYLRGMETNNIWLERFAARLLQLMPQLDALEAVRIASVQIEAAPHLDPELAAELYADKTD